MPFPRFIRTIVVSLTFGLAGSMLGCSGPQDAKPIDQTEGKKIAADMKSAAQEKRAERSQAKAGPSMKESMRGRTKGGGPQ